MVLVLLPPFCLHSKTHFKTCFKKNADALKFLARRPWYHIDF